MQTIPQVSMAIQDKRPSSSLAAWFVDSEGAGEEHDAWQSGLNSHFVCFHDLQESKCNYCTKYCCWWKLRNIFDRGKFHSNIHIHSCLMVNIKTNYSY